MFGVIMGFVWERRLSGGLWGDPKVMVTLAILIAYISRLSHMQAGGGRVPQLCAVIFVSFFSAIRL